MTTGDDIVAAARGWLGTCFHHQGRLKRSAVHRGGVARTGFSFDLPLKYAQLEPSDVITVTAGGVAHRMRIISTHVQAHGIMRVQAVAEDQSTFDFYSSAAQAASLQQEITNATATRLELLDLPALPGESGDGAVLHVAGNGVGSGWTGAAVYRSDDNGANHTRFSDINGAAIIGTSSNALGNASPAVFDSANSLTILMNGQDAQLQSVSELAVLNGGNAALIGSEIIQFKTAILLAPAQYQLSGLLRGRLGTEWAIGGHAAGERFILLDGRVGKQALSANAIGLSGKYKAVSFGNSLSMATEQDFTYAGIALMPYSPVLIQGQRDGSGNLTVTWMRRTRIGGGCKMAQTYRYRRSLKNTTSKC